MTTWGDVFNRCIRVGDDHGYAAHLADLYEDRIMELKLVCCPFCASEVKLHKTKTAKLKTLLYFVKCPDCGMRGPAIEVSVEAVDE